MGLCLLALLVAGAAGRARAQTNAPGAYNYPGSYSDPGTPGYATDGSPGSATGTSDPPGDATGREAGKPAERTYDEVYQLLLDRGLTDDAVFRLLRDYPLDKTFSDSEVALILRRVRPEDLLTRRKKDEQAPEADASTGLPRQRGGPREPTPFGLDIFKNAPATFEPDQGLAVGGDYRLAPGDQMRVTLWGSVQQEFPAEVSREGIVTIPEAGPISAAGMTLDAFEERLTNELKKVYSGFQLAVSMRRLRRIQVVVAGEVTRPGAYFLSPVSSTFNALYFAGGPTTRGTLRRVRVLRDGKVLAEVDLYRYLLEGNAADDVRLLSGDTVFLMSRGPAVTVRGEVVRPAIFEMKGGETLTTAIAMAGGFLPTAYAGLATLDRVSPATGPTTNEIDLSGLLGGGTLPPGRDIVLQDGDDLTIYPLYHVRPREFVEIQGMVQYPGIYPLYPGIRLADLVFRAGGLLDSAYPTRAEVSRLARADAVGGLTDSDSVSQVIYVDLARARLDSLGDQNLLLAKDDKVYVRKIPGWKLQETVKLSGEIKFPGIYPLVRREERLTQLIARAGGPTPQAFLKGASLFREKQGRVIISFEKALDEPGNREDIVMVDGDSVNVPAYPPTILVEGEVGRPGALLFEPGKTASYYVEKTGGTTDQADRGATRVFRVDGVVQKAYRSFWWDRSVEPGSRIVVARKPPGRGVNWGGVIRDTTTILASLVTTAFVISQINK